MQPRPSSRRVRGQVFKSSDLRDATRTFLFLPGSFHNGGVSISFTDGHAEQHRWSVRGENGTVRPPLRGAVGGSFDANPRTDFEWLKVRSSDLK